MIRSNPLLSLMFATAALLPLSSQAVEKEKTNTVPKARARVIVDNDFGGDPDGLFQLAHQLLSPSVEVRGIIGSHHYPAGFYSKSGSPDHACEEAGALLEVMGLTEKVPVYPGADERLKEPAESPLSPGAEFIIREAMRDDVKTPLYIACGAGLTDLASAWLKEPKIAERIRLIWIGGPEHDGLAVPPPGAQRVEYNLGIDLVAGQVVFNQSDIPIWQIPRDAYRQALVSHSELNSRMKPEGKLTAFLHGRLWDLLKRANHSLGEAYVLGDSPLVLLTALQSSWEVDPSSSRYVSLPAPKIGKSGLYENNPQGRMIRVYTTLDNRLMFEDLYAKITIHDSQRFVTGTAEGGK